MYRFTIQGARGTLPSCGSSFVRFGGHTTCFSARTDQGLLVIDAGTGIVQLGHEFIRRGSVPPVTLLFTHFHMDHVIGLPCFDPLYRKNAILRIMADPGRQGNWKKMLSTFISKPFWPVALGESQANMRLRDLPIRTRSLSLYGIDVSWHPVPHPQQCLSYRVTHAGQSVVVATDVEFASGGIDDGFIRFCRNADFLIFDAQFLPTEYPAHRTWGHSTWQVAVEAARRAEVKNLILTHHAPDRKDSGVDRIVRSARAEFRHTWGARCRMELISER